MLQSCPWSHFAGMHLTNIVMYTVFAFFSNFQASFHFFLLFRLSFDILFLNWCPLESRLNKWIMQDSYNLAIVNTFVEINILLVGSWVHLTDPIIWVSITISKKILYFWARSITKKLCACAFASLEAWILNLC